MQEGPQEFQDSGCWEIDKLQMIKSKKHMTSESLDILNLYQKIKVEVRPTTITPRGSAKPERVASLNACHLLI